jgi:hypothetical protein
MPPEVKVLEETTVLVTLGDYSSSSLGLAKILDEK